MINIISGILIAFLTIWGVITIEGGNINTFLCISPLLLILGGTIGTLITSFSFPKVLTAFKLVFSTNNEETEIIQQSAEVFKYAGKYSIGFGLIGFFIGIIFTLSNLVDLSHLGKGLAVVLTSILYGISFAYIIFFPLSINLKNRR